MSGPIDPAVTTNARGSVFRRLEEPDTASKGRLAATLIEIDDEGYIPREVGLAEDGAPVYVTRPGEHGIWNDSGEPRTPPSSPAFDEVWGGLGTPVSADVFEAIFAKADAALPQTVGLTALRVSDVVSWAILLVVVAVLVAGAYALVRLVGG